MQNITSINFIESLTQDRETYRSKANINFYDNAYFENRIKFLIEMREKFKSILNTSYFNSTDDYGMIICPYDFIDRKQGGAIRTKNIIKVLSSNKKIISLSFCWDKDLDKIKITQINKNWLHIDVAHLGSLNGFIKSADFHLINWYSIEMLAAIRELIKFFKISFMWLEYCYMACYAYLAIKNKIKLIISTQNIEWKLVNEMSDSCSSKYIEPFGMALSLKICEENLYELADAIVFTTELDLSYVKGFCQSKSLVVAPNIISFDSVRLYKAQNNHLNFKVIKLLMVGDFKYKPNIDGLTWFCKIMKNGINQIPKNIKFEIDIVGGGSVELLKEIGYLSYVKAHGYVDDLSPFYQSATASLIPLLSGGGSRLKAFEAIENCKYILSTAKGVEGINFNELSSDVFIFEDYEQFMNCIVQLSNAIKNNDYEDRYKKYSTWYQKKQHEFKENILIAAGR